MTGILQGLIGSLGSGRTQIALTISANTSGYDVYTNRGPTYVAGKSDITVTVNPSVVVNAANTSSYAMLVPSAFNVDDTITIVNNGTIVGAGGSGGSGGDGIGTDPGATSTAGSVGAIGGNALYVNRPTTVTNNGTVAAGGGGGGGGGGASTTQVPQPKAPGSIPQSFVAGGGGGGGGAGTVSGNGGLSGSGSVPAVRLPNGFPSPGTAGSAGTASAGGAGGVGGVSPGPPSTPPPGRYAVGGDGGTGGGLGAAGSAGSAGTQPGPLPAPLYPSSQSPGGGGGVAGNYIVGNPFVTWPVTGTRQGNVA